jgi:Flp pilus assembly protein TadG
MMFSNLKTHLLNRLGRVLGSSSARRLVHRQDGAAAVEFALVAAPFIALMFAILETGLVFFASQTLETVASDSARLIMTGQSQTMTQAQFTNAVCAKIYGLFNCSSMLLDVQKYTSFSSANTSLPVDRSGNVQSASFGFNQGGPGDIIVMRLMYPWPVWMSLLGFNLSNMSGNQRLLMATVAFANEPF